MLINCSSVTDPIVCVLKFICLILSQRDSAQWGEYSFEMPKYILTISICTEQFISFRGYVKLYLHLDICRISVAILQPFLTSTSSKKALLNID